MDGVEDVFESLGRDPQELIGEVETDWLEFKREPYHLAQDHACFELAKDVDALCNANGGVIVLGVETAPDTVHQQEKAVKIRPIADGAINVKQIEDVVRAWLYPPQSVRVRPHDVPRSSGRIWTIVVDKCDSRDWPVILVKEWPNESSAHPSRNLVAAYRRAGAHNIPIPAEQLHQWLQRGSSAQSFEHVPTGSTSDDLEALLDSDVQALDFPPNAALYYLQATPERAAQLQRFFRGSADPLEDRLATFEELRNGGFGLPTGLPVSRTNADGLRVLWAGNDSLSVSIHGTATAIEGQEHLTWASARFLDASQEIAINPTALVEFTYEFFRFVESVVRPRLNPEVQHVWRAGMRGLIEPTPVSLPIRPLPRGGGLISDRRRATLNEFELPWQPVHGSAAAAAFAVLAQIYTKFGIDPAAIPYSADDKVSAEVIKDLA